MSDTIIRIDLDAVDQRLKVGELWTDRWGTPDNPDAPTCLHGAIRYCQPIPGDAHIIEQVANQYGFGVRANDTAESWAVIRAKVVPDITDTMLAATFGPQWEPIIALVRRAAILTNTEATALPAADAAWSAAESAALRAARYAAGSAALRAARYAAKDAAGSADRGVWYEARYAAEDAAEALAVRDLIGQHGFEQEHYDMLTQPWATVIGKVHPDDTERTNP